MTQAIQVVGKRQSTDVDCSVRNDNTIIFGGIIWES
jgi:hypothetical protein